MGNDTLDLKSREGEVQDQAVLPVGGSEVRSHRGEVNGLDGFHGFQLYDHLTLDKQIEPMVADFDFLEEDVDGALPAECDAVVLKRFAQRLLVDSFQEARSEGPMDGDGRGDDAMGQFVMFKHSDSPAFLSSCLPEKEGILGLRCPSIAGHLWTRDSRAETVRITPFFLEIPS